MKFLFTAIFVLLAAVVIAMLARNDPGYIMINYRDWAIETSLVLAVIVILMVFFVLYLLIRFFVNTKKMPRNIGEWQQQRRITRANDALTTGLLELAKGEWSKAEKHLTKYIGDTKMPLLNYLAAARATQKLGNDQQRDHYLQLAHQSMPKAELAIALTHAELQISHGQMEQALATLSTLQRSSPKHATVLKLLMRLYVELHDWERLLELVPALLRRKLVDREESERLQMLAYAGLLHLAARDSDRMIIHDVWRRIPKAIRLQDTMMVEYVQNLVLHKEFVDAAELIQQFLSKNWSDRLVYIYGTIEADLPRQIRYVETWQKSYDRNAVLLLTLGRLCMRKQLWARSQECLEASLALAPQAETYRELAQLHEQMGAQDKAMDYYRQGLMSVPDSNCAQASLSLIK